MERTSINLPARLCSESAALMSRKDLPFGRRSAWNVRVGDCASNRRGNKSRWHRSIFTSRDQRTSRQGGARYRFMRTIPTVCDLYVRTVNPSAYTWLIVRLTAQRTKWNRQRVYSLLFFPASRAQNGFQTCSRERFRSRTCKIVTDREGNQ